MYGRLDQPDPTVNTQGTGFGLEISDQLARLLSDDMENGGVKVESKEGVGTTFSFSIKDKVCYEHNKDDNDSCYDSEMKYYEPGIFEEDIEDISVKMSPYSSPSYAIYSEKTLIPRGSRLTDLNCRFMSGGNESDGGINDIKSESIEESVGHEYFPQKRTSPKPKFNYKTGLSMDSKALTSELGYFERIKSREPSSVLFRRRSSIIPGKVKILLVDDNTFNLLIAKTLLESLNYSVDTALNGKLAIEEVVKAKSSSDDSKLCAILMDIQMPVMDGYEATRELKQMMRKREIPDIPIIALSANDSEDDKKRSLEVGMYKFLSKPLKESSLRATLEEIFSRVLPDEFYYQTIEEEVETPKKEFGFRKKASLFADRKLKSPAGSL